MPTKTTDAPTARQRLAEIKADLARRTVHQEELLKRVMYGRSPEDKEKAVAALIAGAAVGSPDAEAEWKKNGQQIKDLAAAVAILEDRVARDEIEAQYPEAARLVAFAQGFVPKINAAFAGMEKLMREKRAAYDAALLAHPEYPGMKPPYDLSALIPLHAWCTEDFLGDGYNKSRLDRWREDARERGYKV
jgi:hypothetical protein